MISSVSCLRVMITGTNSSINLGCVNLKFKQACIFPIICTYFNLIVFCIVFDWKEMQDNKQLSENKINSRLDLLRFVKFVKDFIENCKRFYQKLKV